MSSVPGPISPNDPRLRGHPVGCVSPVRDTQGEIVKWCVSIQNINPIGSPRKRYTHYLHYKDFGNDVEKARQAALTEVQTISWNIGVNKNRCRLLADGIIEMELTLGYSMLILAVSFEMIYSRIWYASETLYGTAYAHTKAVPGSSRPLSCQRFLLNAAPGQLVDHKNGNSLDNRLTNLRLVNTQQNSQNTLKESVSGIPGVRAGRNKKGELVSIRVAWRQDNKSFYDTLFLSRYGTPLEAVKAGIALRYAMEDLYDIQSARRIRGSAYQPPTAEVVLERFLAPRPPKKKRRRSEAEEDPDTESDEKGNKKARIDPDAEAAATRQREEEMELMDFLLPNNV